MSFTELNLIGPLTAALAKKGYNHPTPIQKESIPHVLSGKDVFGSAQTGTGKTAAFALPILQMLYNRKQQGKLTPGVKALILAPTRELALQIGENFSVYGAGMGLTHTIIYGGVNQNPQTRVLSRGVDILIATPGRLLDLINQGFIRLDSVGFFVLDEADRMLDMGFIRDIKKIIAKLPLKRQTLFFSATASPEIMKLANTILHNPVSVAVSPVSSTAPLVKQSVYYVKRENKQLLLSHLLSGNTIGNALVFTRTKRGADRVSKNLNKSGISAEAIHGNKSQAARERALKGFKNRKIKVLVATDIASRGIDVKELSHVINYELPEQAETYVHRIGRTGRAGSPGTAYSLCAHEETGYLRDIHKLIRQNLEVVEKHPFI